jgi:hypothetical protein
LGAWFQRLLPTPDYRYLHHPVTVLLPRSTPHDEDTDPLVVCANIHPVSGMPVVDCAGFEEDKICYLPPQASEVVGSTVRIRQQKYRFVPFAATNKMR